MTEKLNLWHPMRDATRCYGTDLHWNRIENAVSVGITDVIGTFRGSVAWIEMKIVKGRQIVLQQFQPNFIHKQYRAGGRVWILARSANWCQQGDHILLWHAQDLPKLLEGAVLNTKKQIVTRDITSVTPRLVLPKPFDWHRLMRVMFEEKY